MKFSSATLCLTLLAALPGLAFAAETTAQATRMTDAQIQQKLKADGYTNVQVTDHDKDHIDVKATKNGKTDKLAVNPVTGASMPDNDND
jgi:pyruvate/2-oxoacid:ferredoxin oxidoreductase beta subunit